MNRHVCIVVAVLALVAFGACSEDNKVGTGVKVEKGEGGTGRLGATTTTEAPKGAAPTTTAAPVATTAKAATPTTAAPAPTTTAPVATTAPQAQAFVIEIYGDNSGKKQFEPPQSGVRLGTVVRWVNKDTVVRGVESPEAGFSSAPTDIPPGGSFEFKTDAKGTFNYQDTTRPYAVGVLQVG